MFLYCIGTLCQLGLLKMAAEKGSRFSAFYGMHGPSPYSNPWRDEDGTTIPGSFGRMSSQASGGDGSEHRDYLDGLEEEASQSGRQTETLTDDSKDPPLAAESSVNVPGNSNQDSRTQQRSVGLEVLAGVLVSASLRTLPLISEALSLLSKLCGQRVMLGLHVPLSLAVSRWILSRCSSGPSRQLTLVVLGAWAFFHWLPWTFYRLHSSMDSVPVYGSWLLRSFLTWISLGVVGLSTLKWIQLSWSVGSAVQSGLLSGSVSLEAEEARLKKFRKASSRPLRKSVSTPAFSRGPSSSFSTNTTAWTSPSSVRSSRSREDKNNPSARVYEASVRRARSSLFTQSYTTRQSSGSSSAGPSPIDSQPPPTTIQEEEIPLRKIETKGKWSAKMARGS